MQACVEKRVQAEHAPETHQDRFAGELPQRRHRQGEHEEAQRPQAEAVFDFRHRIGAERVAAGAGHAPDLRQQDRQRHQRGEVDQGFRDDDARIDAASRFRHGFQNHFLKSMPAYMAATWSP